MRAAERGERLVEQGTEWRTGVLGPDPRAGAAAVRNHRQRDRRGLPFGLAEETLDPPRDLCLWRHLFGHLVRNVAPEPFGAVFDEGGDQRVLGREVPVERVVGEPRLRDDVGDARLRGRTRTADDREGGVERCRTSEV